MINIQGTTEYIMVMSIKWRCTNFPLPYKKKVVCIRIRDPEK